MSSPCQLFYTRSNAKIKILELDEDGNVIGGDTSDDGPSISTAVLQNAVQGEFYSRKLTAVGETPMVWELVDGVLPYGMDMDQDGTISGTPAEIGKFSFTVRVINNAGSAMSSMSLTVDYPPVPEEEP